MRIKGFDINRAQENIDFDKIEKSGAKFVILRAGIRTDTDTYFQYYLDECIKKKTALWAVLVFRSNFGRSV